MADGLARQWSLPAAVGRDGRFLTLSELLSSGGAEVALAPTREQRAALVRARWEAGEWDDILICDDAVDLERGVRELEAGSSVGEALLEIGELAIAMVIEDARARSTR